MTNQEVLAAVQQRFADAIVEHAEFRGELTIVIRGDRIVEMCRFLKEDPRLRFDLLSDVHGIDMYTPVDRFGVIYNVFSLSNKIRLRLKVFTQGDDPVVPSVTGVWETADWHEREAYDMLGIRFEGHPDLRRVYLPEEFEHFPLRKDFPLMGIPGSLALPKK